MIFNFQSIPVTFFSVACIALGQKSAASLRDMALCSPETAVAMPEVRICFRVPTTKPQILPQDPPLVDVCALCDDADPMRRY